MRPEAGLRPTVGVAATTGLLRGRRATHYNTLEFSTAAAVARELGLLTDEQAKAQVAYHQRRIDAH
jgi:hypothetical protein